MLRRIDRLILRVPALQSAVRYYRDVLGLNLIRHDKQVAAFVMADGATELVLRADPDQPAEEIYYLVDDVRDLYRRRNELQLKFVQSPQQVSRGFKATVKDPFGNVLMMIDRTTETSAPVAVEDAAGAATLFAGVEQAIPAKREALAGIYQAIGRTADDLPYTPQFEKLFSQYGALHQNVKPTRKEVWRHLLNLRKAGKLPRLGEARSESPPISPEQSEQLRALLGADIGKRDRLPYTDRFNELVDAFNKTQSRPISPHLVWRLVAKLAK